MTEFGMYFQVIRIRSWKLVCLHTIVKLIIISKTKNRRNSFIPAVWKYSLLMKEVNAWLSLLSG
jgi:hypothetical protein